jgi:ABC-2 type transport system ATP-binding protein
MWDEIARLRTEGMTIFLTTHYLDEADALCDRIAIIDHGAVVAEGTPTQLKREITGDVVTIGVADNAAKAGELLDGQPYIRSVDVRDDACVRLYVDAGESAMPQILRALDASAIELRTIELHRPSLDDVFLTKTGRSLRES